jgi:hypothetical protein
MCKLNICFVAEVSEWSLALSARWSKKKLAVLVKTSGIDK